MRILSVALFCIAIPAAAQQTAPPFGNPALSPEERAANILSLMTLDEKIAALGNPAVPRLGIPSYGTSEGIHQVVLRGGRGGSQPIPTTSFSQVYGMGETWDPALITRAGAVEGYEARYVSQNKKYNRNTLILMGPTSDLARDPRWGRTDESFGEDPFLTGTLAVALVKGIQGSDPKYWQAASLLKHLFANSNETTRAFSSSDFDERLMREYYSVPFRMAFVEGGAKSFMAAYNAWNGIPMAVNPVLKDVVAKEWKAGWIITPDAGAMGHVVNLHKSPLEAYVAALKLGVGNLGGGFGRGGGPTTAELMKEALERKLIVEADLDGALAGKYKTIVKLGLLDPPAAVTFSKIGASVEPEPWNGENHKSVARAVAHESVVLLKNADGLLPLDRGKVKSIAVVGPRADAVLFDYYSGPTPYSISVLKGIRDKAGSSMKVTSAENAANAVSAAKASEVAIVAVGNDPMCGAANPGGTFNPDGSTKPCGDPGEGREGRDREKLDLPPAQAELIREVYAANHRTIVVLISSFPFAIDWEQQNVPAILHITHAAQEQGAAVADVLFGEYNPAGRLVQTWPRSLDQLPDMMDYDIRHGRTYMYFKGEPLYPFGYGLSYTTFQYSNVKLSAARLAQGGTVTVSVDVKNTGGRAGDEVVQMYIQHPRSNVPRPLRELKGFERVTLKPNETKTVQFPLAAASLSYWNAQKHAWEVEREPVKISIGGSSANLALDKTIEVQ
ncbi:MAG TPA: glycoside hydrolase family 3 C-terminal domain-containing protein [Bryobacteraceae bacterium]|nr:glycoside hydrolase family 3 C-terminal domain-containing protein [Bryobacteraceae bacterium]